MPSQPTLLSYRASRFLRSIAGIEFITVIRERRRRDELGIRDAIASLVRDARRVRWTPPTT
jgi:hypothetical protein